MVPPTAHHQVARVVVGEAEDQAARLDDPHQLPGVRERARHRLVADDVEAVLQELLADGEVEGVARNDRHQVDAPVFGQGGLGLGHLLVGAVAALGGHVHLPADLEAPVVVAAEAAGDEFGLVVHQGGDAMGDADAASAADHSQPELAFRRLHGRSST